MERDLEEPASPPAAGIAPQAPAPDAPESGGALRAALSLRRPRLWLFVYTLLFGGFAYWSAGYRDFWGEEATTALVVREMADRVSAGDASALLLPTLGGRAHLVRPPLVYWPSLAASFLPGVPPEIAFRIPSLLFSFLGLWSTWALGRRLFTPAIAFLAVSIHASTLLYFFHAAWLGSDLPFAVSLQLAFVGFVLGGHQTRPGRWRLLGWIGLAAASLEKSPLLALGLVLPALILHLALGGGRLARVRRGLREAFVGLGPIVYVLLVAPWYVWAAIFHRDALIDQHLREGHLARFLGEPPYESAPYYYLLALPIAFLPWSLFLPLGVFHGKDRLGRPGQRSTLSFALFVFIALSFTGYRESGLLLPMWSSIALLIAAAHFETREQFSLWEDYLCDAVYRMVPLFLRLPLIATAIAAALWYAKLYERLPESAVKEFLSDRATVQVLLGIAAIGGVVAFLSGRRIERLVRDKDLGRASLEFARTSLFVLFAFSFAALALNPLFSARPFLAKVERKVGAARLVTYASEQPGEVAFYLRAREVDHLPQLISEPPADDEAAAERTRRREAFDALVASAEPVYLLLSDADYQGLRIHFSGLAARFAETGVAGRMGIRGEFVLLESRER